MDFLRDAESGTHQRDAGTGGPCRPGSAKGVFRRGRRRTLRPPGQTDTVSGWVVVGYGSWETIFGLSRICFPAAFS